MNKSKIILMIVAALALTGCEGGGILANSQTSQNKSIDRGSDVKHLSQLKAGIWVDPNGCDHWIIDDGVEGYLDVRLDPYGKPVCSGVAPPTVATGLFKQGSNVQDPF